MRLVQDRRGMAGWASPVQARLGEAGGARNVAVRYGWSWQAWLVPEWTGSATCGLAGHGR